MHRSFPLPALLLLVPAFAACQASSTRDAQTVRVRKAPAQADGIARAEFSLPVLEPAYAPEGKRDPFRSVSQNQDPVACHPGGLCLPLDQLRLRGVVHDTARPSALLEDGQGQGHIVHIGQAVGTAGGVVKRITASEVHVDEALVDWKGTRVERTRILALADG